jgi:hypothetical protein
MCILSDIRILYCKVSRDEASVLLEDRGFIFLAGVIAPSPRPPLPHMARKYGKLGMKKANVDKR